MRWIVLLAIIYHYCQAESVVIGTSSCHLWSHDNIYNIPWEHYLCAPAGWFHTKLIGQIDYKMRLELEVVQSRVDVFVMTQSQFNNARLVQPPNRLPALYSWPNQTNGNFSFTWYEDQGRSVAFTIYNRAKQVEYKVNHHTQIFNYTYIIVAITFSTLFSILAFFVSVAVCRRYGLPLVEKGGDTGETKKLINA